MSKQQSHPDPFVMRLSKDERSPNARHQRARTSAPRSRPSPSATASPSSPSLREMVLDYLALGIDPERSVVFVQSTVPETAELDLIFEMLISLPRLERLPSIKEMAEAAHLDVLPFGLVGYPVLQAADILLPRADLVPVGRDNVPHVEITREIARRFNALYGDVFPEPEALVSEVPTLPGIYGTQKMSKSLDNAILISDAPAVVRQRVMQMYTDPNRVRADIPGTVEGNPVFTYHDVSREKTVDQMKTEFIAVASHELRTPMTSIKGSIDLILSGFAGEISAETQELLEIAQNSCDRLIRLINGILDLAKIEAGQIKLNPVRLDLREVAERSIRSVRSLADRSEVTLALDQPEDLPTVDADKDRIEQVVTNLLSNAIKFSPPKGEVRVELKTENAWVKCSVVDQGPGIQPEDLERVFGKFQQVGDSRRKGGTGLGLAITQALVHEHKGRIWVESKVNEGSRFNFVLPISPAKS